MLNQAALEHAHMGDVFAPGKLDPVAHAALVNDLPRFAREAGVSVRDISGANYSLTEFEIEYLRAFRRQASDGVSGVLYIGAHDPNVHERMRSAVGALLRNYIPARFLLRDELIHELWDLKRTPRGDLVAVPDLSVKGLPDAPRRALMAWLSRRITRGEQTMVGVASPAAFDEMMGSDAPYIKKNFWTLTGVPTL